MAVSRAVLLLVLLPGSIDAAPFPNSPPGEWEWVDVEGSVCMNGKPTGVYIKRAPKNVSATSLGIYHDGGGACFNLFTCNTCATSGKPGAPPTHKGVFDSADPRNPYRDFNWIFVPYCTGDVHAGNSQERFELAERRFHGHDNIKLVAERALQSFPQVDTLVITGESAGGFGALTNYNYYRGLFGSHVSRGVLVDDSGPVLDDQAIAPCLQEKWRATWNINASLDPDCPCVGDGGNLVSIWRYIRDKWPHDSLGLISSVDDGTISSFFAFGLDGCKKLIPTGYGLLSAGLRRLSATGLPVYMIPGDTHVHCGGQSEFYSRTVNGVALYKWVGQLIGGGPDPGSVVPVA